jgi:hypothetical protein
MQDKQHILDSIAEVAKQLGHAPSLKQFVGAARISKSSVWEHFRKWNDAVRAAGLEPRRLYKRLEDEDLLKDWGETARKKGGLPSRRGYLQSGQYEPRTLKKRFGGWEHMAEAFCKFAEGKQEWADVVELVARRAPKRERGLPKEDRDSTIPQDPTRHTALDGRARYGNPLDFRGLRHEPVNEQGVILVFGMVAKELGYLVESLQTGFPDCEAKRQIGPEHWQRVQIVFEFESRNFRDHRHPSNGCDVIVCWRHNWDECPGQIEVVELCSAIKSLAGSASKPISLFNDRDHRAKKAQRTQKR